MYPNSIAFRPVRAGEPSNPNPRTTFCHHPAFPQNSVDEFPSAAIQNCSSQVLTLKLVPRPRCGTLEDYRRATGMLTNNFRIAKMQKTLRWFEEDVPLLNMRVKELSAERQESARRFAAAVIQQTRAELEMLLQQQPDDCLHAEDLPCEPAD
jgi:hypothetical protein